MKLKESQLRTIIRQELKKLNEQTSLSDQQVVEQAASALAIALEDTLSRVSKQVTRDATNQLGQSAPQLRSPEAVESYAAAIADVLSQDNMMKAVFEQIAANMLRQMMSRG